MEVEEVIIRYWTALSLFLAFTLTACTHAASPEQASTANNRFRVIGADGPVVGINLYALRNYPTSQVEIDGARTLWYIRDVLHAMAVDIVWNFYTSNSRKDNVSATSATLSPSNVALLTRIAERDHLLVEYRPLIMVMGNAPWEGNIDPSDPSRWFDRYYNDELPYLKMAEKYGVNEFVAATEMKALNDSGLWPSFFRRIARVYRGVVSYTAWQTDYFPPGTGLLPVRYLGVDMYVGLHLPPSASTAQVTAAYESSFAQMSTSILRRTAIDETGIAARAGAYQEPEYLQIPGALDETVQANWFSAACNAVKRFHLRAVFFWKVDLTDNPIAHPAHSLSTFEGKEGAQAIGNCSSTVKD
jgi:hypothetical protein